MFEKIICCTEYDGAWCCWKCGQAFHWKEKAWHNLNQPNRYLCDKCKEKEEGTT
jgi:hypothetical protein